VAVSYIKWLAESVDDTMAFGRLKTGFTLARRSATALRDHPKLVLFPVLAGSASLAYLGVLWTTLLSFSGDANALTLVALACFYVGSTFIASFSTAGLMYCSRQAFAGESPRIRDGLRAASRNLAPLLAWSIVSALVGMLLRILEENDTPLSLVTAAVFSVAWSVMTFFVVPVIVFEDVGVVGMFARSKEIVVETWGESMGAIGGVGVVTIALGFAGAIPGFLILWAVPESAGILGFFALIVAVLVAMLIGQALTGVAKTALYLYAVEDESPRYFDGVDFGGGGSTGPESSTRIPGSGGII